jgi:hypothetical protein
MEKKPELQIDVNNLSLEMASQAANFLYVAEQAVKASAVYDTTKYKMDQILAEVDAEIRAGAAAEGRKLTEKTVEAELELDGRVKDIKLKVIKAKAERDMLIANREAWYSRKDMLIQLAIKERNEIDAITGTKVVAGNGV